jgi:hypothetical protein
MTKIKKKKKLKVCGYYFDGKDSYTLYEDDRGNIIKKVKTKK